MDDDPPAGKRRENIGPEWERRITNLVVTAVILYIGHTANNLETSLKVLSVEFKNTVQRMEEVIKKNSELEERTLSNLIDISDLKKRISKLEG